MCSARSVPIGEIGEYLIQFIKKIYSYLRNKSRTEGITVNFVINKKKSVSNDGLSFYFLTAYACKGSNLSIYK